MRQQVHAAIRKLDAGDMDKTAFRRRLTELGIVMPPEAERLWNRHSADSNAPFKDWVRAFEPFFMDSTRPVPPSPEPVPSPEPASRASKAKARVSTGHPTSNGDVLTWAAAPTTEEPRATRRHSADVAHRGDPKLLVPDEAPEPHEDVRAMRRTARESTNFAWHSMFIPEQPTHVPLRAGYRSGAASASKPPPFSYLGEPEVTVLATGVTRHRPPPSRAPFGTEADVRPFILLLFKICVFREVG